MVNLYEYKGSGFFQKGEEFFTFLIPGYIPMTVGQKYFIQVQNGIIQEAVPISSCSD